MPFDNAAETRVCSIADAFAWPDDVLDTVVAHFGDEVLSRAALAADGLSLSTSFSGIGAPEHAHDALCKALALRSGKTIRQHHLFAIDWNAGCRTELAQCPSPPQCIFGDIHGWLHARVQSKVVAQLKSFTLEQLMAIVTHANGLATTCYCHQHQTECPLRMATIHVAGPPCTDWSSFGSRLGEGGKTALALAIWIGHRLKLREPIIIHENVEQCDMRIVKTYLEALDGIGASPTSEMPDRFAAVKAFASSDEGQKLVDFMRGSTAQKPIVMHKGYMQMMTSMFVDDAAGKPAPSLVSIFKTLLCFKICPQLQSSHVALV